ncbi:MAG: DUF4296 domain-containing protein [Flavobacteriales bacterium]|jgi:protein-disulfide isomerase-like protein with CxxC motif|nr:DUF4296 domain-containing protein [Flavobacteriales bacterium]MCI1751386.1 DUF4296 domain-containing protein [Flavobacteriales bacterium]
MRNGLATVLLLLFVACGGKEAPPKAPLNKEKFEQVLLRSLLIEARTGQRIAGDSAMYDVQAEYDAMFAKEGVSRADFDSTYNAYLRQPDALKAVYEKVLNDLQQPDSTVH